MAANELFLTTLFTDPNLQFYARFESNVVDSSANAYNLTANNTPGYSAGQFGNQIDFVKSSTQSASIAGASCANLNITGSQTWMCWIKLATKDFTQEAFCKYNGTTGLVRFQINGTGAPGSNQVFFQLLGLTTNAGIFSTFNFDTGVRHHIAGTYDSVATTINIYVDGSLDSSLTASGSANDNAGEFDIGRLNAALGEYLDGSVDDFAVFNRALSTTEISNYYTGTTPLLPTASNKSFMKTNTSFWGA